MPVNPSESVASAVVPAIAAPAAPPAPARALTELDDAGLSERLGLSSAIEGDAEPGPSDAEVRGREELARELGIELEDGSADPAAPAAAAATPAAPAPAAPAAPAAPDRPAPITEFTVTDAAGAPLAELPDIRITFKGNKQTYENVSLDKVVRLAQHGAYNAQLMQMADDARQVVPQLQQEIQRVASTYEQEVQAQEQFLVTLMESEDQYLAARERYHKNVISPEARARRAEEALRLTSERQQQERYQQGVQQEAAASSQFLESRVAPMLAQVLEQYPQVSVPEVRDRFFYLTAPFTAGPGGRIPPAAFEHVLNMVQTELAPWIAQLHEHREVSTRQQQGSVAQVRADATRQAQVQVAQVKRDLARPLKPAGKASPDTPRRTASRTVDDAMQNILRDVLRSV